MKLTELFLNGFARHLESGTPGKTASLLMHKAQQLVNDLNISQEEASKISIGCVARFTKCHNIV